MTKLMKQGIACIVLGGSLLLTACGGTDAIAGQGPASTQPAVTGSTAPATEATTAPVETADTGMADQLIGFWETEWTFDSSVHTGSTVRMRAGLDRLLERMDVEDGDTVVEVIEFRLTSTGQVALRQQVYIDGESIFTIAPETVVIDGNNFYTSAQNDTWRRIVHEINNNEMVIEFRGETTTWRRTES